MWWDRIFSCSLGDGRRFLRHLVHCLRESPVPVVAQRVRMHLRLSTGSQLLQHLEHFRQPLFARVDAPSYGSLVVRHEQIPVGVRSPCLSTWASYVPIDCGQEVREQWQFARECLRPWLANSRIVGLVRPSVDAERLPLPVDVRHLDSEELASAQPEPPEPQNDEGVALLRLLLFEGIFRMLGLDDFDQPSSAGAWSSASAAAQILSLWLLAASAS